jgi:hypothetical protein
MDDLLVAQKRLGQSLELASIGEDRQLAADVREKGESFANLFYGALRMCRVYDRDNESFERPLEELGKLLAWLLHHLGVVHLVTVEDQVYINDIRIRFERTRSAATQLGGELHRHNVGGVSFYRVPERDPLLVLMTCLAGQPADAERRATLCRVLAERGVSGVELRGINRYLMSGEEQIETEWTDVLLRATQLVEEVWENVAAGRMLNPLPLRRVVVEILAPGIDTEGLWLTVPGATDHGRHAVRVCRLALAIGTGVGLSDKTLQDLGVTALVHDIGYALPSRTGKVSLKDHLTNGVMVMLEQRGFHVAKLQRILGILYHHHNVSDLGGTPSLFGRVLRIAEDLDNLCQPRGGQLSPPAALGAMLGRSGRAYDATLLQAAVNRLGRYPPGTRVQLGDGEPATVISLVRGKNFDKPRVVTTDGRIRDLLQEGRIAQVIEH